MSSSKNLSDSTTITPKTQAQETMPIVYKPREQPPKRLLLRIESTCGSLIRADNCFKPRAPGNTIWAQGSTSTQNKRINTQTGPKTSASTIIKANQPLPLVQGSMKPNSLNNSFQPPPQPSKAKPPKAILQIKLRNSSNSNNSQTTPKMDLNPSLRLAT